MSDKVEFVESLSIKVGRFLLAKGFGLASCAGFALDSLDKTDSLGILFKDPETKPRKYLFGLFKRNPRRMFLGTVWFSNSACSAGEQNWVFETYGRRYVELVRQLAKEMASAFNVKISLRLTREQPNVENFDSDFDDM